MTDGKTRPPRVTGIRHLVAATSYSLGGLRRLWAESAFRHEVLGAVAVLCVLAYLGKPPIDFMIFAVLFLLLVAVEAAEHRH